jgi:hypothetical protein
MNQISKISKSSPKYEFTKDRSRNLGGEMNSSKNLLQIVTMQALP